MKPAAPAAFTAEQHLAAMNRRHFLRGLGACIALPSLASLVPTRALAAAPNEFGRELREVRALKSESLRKLGDARKT